MVKIGKAYFDDNMTWALAPSMGYEEDRYMVVLQNGTKVNIPATDKEVTAAMLHLGYDPRAELPLADLLNDDEYEELMDALEDGCTWMAKDIRGVCYGFLEEPEKQGAYFQDPSGVPGKRLTAEFRFLEEGEKIRIQEIFEPGSYGSVGGGAADES